MEPHNADENEADAPEQYSTRAAPRRKRALLFGATGVVVVAAVIAAVIALSGGSSDEEGANTDQAAATATSDITVTLPSSTTTTSEQAQPPGSVRLPDGGTANLVKRGLTDNGTLPIPQDLNKATWWGAGLGESGAMLLSGHVNWQGQVGPFKELLRADSGQRVTVRDGSGAEWTYRVNDIREIDKEKLPSMAPELFKQSGQHRLVLVTCGGEFVGGSTGYSSNVIATAELVSSPA